MLHRVAFEIGTVLVAPPAELCTDNGAMIAWAGAERLALGLADTLDSAPRARWPLEVTNAPARRVRATDMAFDRITVLGAGAWGSALANVALRAGRRVTLWARDPDGRAGWRGQGRARGFPACGSTRHRHHR